jgi:hypothetical protein
MGIGLIAHFAVLSGNAAPPIDAAAELLANNPFTDSVVKKPAESPQFELRGVIKEKDGYLLNIYDVGAKTSAWVKEGRRDGNFRLNSYDPTTRVAALEKDGQRFSVVDRAARSSMGASRAITTRAKVQTIAISAVAVAPPESEVRRLEQASQEIRALRESRRKAGKT